jgi:hypothetical protein
MMLQPIRGKNLPSRDTRSLILGTTSEGMQYSLTDQLFERHKWVLGISGSGKSYFLASLICQIFAMGIHFCLIDPHGDLAKLILSLLASYNYYSDPRAYQKVYYCDFSRAAKDAALPFNILNQPYLPHTTASNLLTAIHRAFPTSNTTASLDNVILASALVLIENHRPLTDLSRLILEADYRDALVSRVSDPLVKQFFIAKFSEKVSSQLVDSTLRRSFLLTFSPVLRNTLGQTANKLNFRSLMDQGVSVICNLGGLDEETTKFLGCLLTTSLEQAFLSRADIDRENRLPYHVFIDEFPLFTAQSEASFTNILEQVRKYNGVLYLANQTLGQLSSGMASSLQNAISINMKAGYKDSNELQSNFYRPVVEKPEGLIEAIMRLFGLLPERPQHAFAGLTTSVEARAVFENLQRQEALITINGQTTRILTDTIPTVTISKAELKAIEDTYASLLLTPLADLQKRKPEVTEKPTLTLVATPPPQAKRRMPHHASIGKQAANTLVGCSGTDEELLLLMSQYHYMTVSQVARVLQKESSINNIRTKLNKLKDMELLETVSLSHKGTGKPPTIFTLSNKGMKKLNEEQGLHLVIPTGTRKHGYVEHTLDVNTTLITAALLPAADPSFTLIDVLHERMLKASPWKVQDSLVIPDGYVSFILSGAPYGKSHEQVNIAFEIDRNSEEKEKIQGKLQAYCSYAATTSQSLTVAFMVVSGADRRVRQLRDWSESYLENTKEYAELFLFGAPPMDSEPTDFFTGEHFVSPFDSLPHALIEQIA